MIDLRGYTGVSHLKFWCQKVLPTVYDDSLSYYELLNKVVVYLNDVISDLDTVESNVADIATVVNQLSDALDAVEADLADTKDRVSTNENAIQVLEGTVGDIVNDVDDIQSNIENLCRYEIYYDEPDGLLTITDLVSGEVIVDNNTDIRVPEFAAMLFDIENNNIKTGVIRLVYKPSAYDSSLEEFYCYPQINYQYYKGIMLRFFYKNVAIDNIYDGEYILVLGYNTPEGILNGSNSGMVRMTSYMNYDVALSYPGDPGDEPIPSMTITRLKCPSRSELISRVTSGEPLSCICYNKSTGNVSSFCESIIMGIEYNTTTQELIFYSDKWTDYYLLYDSNENITAQSKNP